MMQSRWVTTILLMTWLFTGCHNPNPPAYNPTPQEATDSLPVPGSEEEDVISMKQQLPYLIGAYYYPWYSPDRHWDSGYRGTPVLGEYDSADPDTINQHIAWAAEYGVDFFAVSWWGKGSFEDKVIHGSFLDAFKGHDFRFAVLYESPGQLKLRAGKINLDDDTVRQQFVSDFAYLAETLFQHPNILTVGGRPVIFLYLTRTFVGDVKTAQGEAKAAAVAQGSVEPFIVGDEVYWQYPDQERTGYFDGVTAYNMHTSVPNIAVGFAENVERHYRLWAKIAAKQGTAPQ